MDFTEGSKDDGLKLSAEVFCFTPPALKKLREKQAKAAKAGKPVPTADTLPEMPTGKAIPADEKLVLTNTTDRALKYRFDPCELREFTISFKPSSGTLKPHKSVSITAKLTVHFRVNTNYRVTLKVNDGTSSHFITAKIRCETGVFGVDPATLEMCDDSFGKESKTWRVPVILKNLKDCLIAAGGLKSEGVFRLAGELTVLKSTKEHINRSSATNGGPGCIEGEHGGLPDDVNDLATLIKIWYRELPQPILNGLPTQVIVDSDDVADCVAATAQLPQLQRDLLEWILELLLRVAVNRPINKMSAQNLAIVVAPNLYEATTPDPMQGLVMSQKAVQFVHNILVNMVREREKATGTKLDTELHKKDLKHTPCSMYFSKGPVQQPVSTPRSSANNLHAEEGDKGKKKKPKADDNDDKKRDKKKKKKEHHHHHHHHREPGDAAVSKEESPKKEKPKKEQKEEEPKDSDKKDSTVTESESTPETPSAAGDDKSHRSSNADRQHRSSHADKTRRSSHADKSHRKESHADKSDQPKRNEASSNKHKHNDH